MNLIGGHTSLLSPDACQTAIDKVLYEEFDREKRSSYLSARDEFFFKQGTTNKMVEIWDEDSNVGEFEAVNEQQEIPTTNTFIGNQSSKRITKYVKDIPISDEAFITDQVGKRQRIGYQIGDRARMTQDKKAILNTYGDAFSGSISTTPDGDALASSTHTTLMGYTVDNLETGALSPDNLWTCVKSLTGQKAQDGDPGGYEFEGLVIPFTLYKTAKEVLDSELLANSGENNINIFETEFGAVAVKASIYLDSTYNSDTYAATGYHLISRNHMIQRRVLYDMKTTMIEPQYTRNDSWELRAKFAEMAFPGSWSGYVGSNGSA